MPWPLSSVLTPSESTLSSRLLDGVVLRQHPRQQAGVGRQAGLAPVAGVEHRHGDAEAGHALVVQLAGADDRRVEGFGAAAGMPSPPPAVELELDAGVGEEVEAAGGSERVLGGGERRGDRVDDGEPMGRRGADRGDRGQRRLERRGLDQGGNRGGSVRRRGRGGGGPEARGCRKKVGTTSRGLQQARTERSH